MMAEYYFVISIHKPKKYLFGKNKGKDKPLSAKLDGPYGMTEEMAFWLANKNGEDGLLSFVYRLDTPDGKAVLESFCNGELKNEPLFKVSPRWAEEPVTSEV